MAAYAALLSVMHIIDQIKHHPFPPISLDKSQVESLIENVTFLQEFLEGYSHDGSKEADSLEGRIAEAAYAAEDMIESHIVDQILAGSTSHGKKISYIDLHQCLQEVIQDMDFIKTEVMEIKEKMGIQDQQQRNSISAGSLRSASMGQSSNMVGFDDILYEMIDKLTGGQRDHQIIPIVGMGGIGKTTLAKNIYENQVVVQHFDTLAWVTISHEYIVREILLELVLCLKSKGSRESLSRKSEDKLGEMLYKSLSGSRYLIIMDDLWSFEVWDKVRIFFPNKNKGSRIMITTRLSNLAFELSGSHGLKMNFLDENKSWNLLCKNVFGKESCPLELEEIGKKIAKNCKGLPLSIVVIGGLLAKSKRTQGYWEYIAENLNSIVNLEDNKRCLEILYTSYYQLPIHLKPCFLYMGVFPGDSKIRVSGLIKLWVAEGFLRPTCGKSLEEVAEEYLKELIDRNLILVHEQGSDGKTKFCKIHDLLKDLCLREAEKYKFLYVIQQNPQGRITQRRIGISQCASMKEYFSRVLHALEYASLARSLICNFDGRQYASRDTVLEKDYLKGFSQSFNLRLLRLFKLDHLTPDIAKETYNIFRESIFKLFNMRYLSYPQIGLSIPSSVCSLWNLHTLIGRNTSVIAPSEIWKMPLLKHVEFGAIYLPDPPNGHMRDDFVLGNLQSLFTIRIQDCRETVVKRIPNIKKLKICQWQLESGSVDRLNNLCHLHKLESLHCSFIEEHGIPRELLQNLTFPDSLKKLTLQGTSLRWGNMTAKIGSLPLLQVLKLKGHSVIGPKWVTFEGQFSSLKFLLIQECGDLKYWKTDRTHFPCLEHLGLHRLEKLKKIPSGIGEIPTLQSIKLVVCSSSAVISAKRIVEEQEELGNEGLQVGVKIWRENEELLSLASPNFQVEYW